ncbi:MAG: S9 family peptidase [Trueperaceae bacterium]|nr:MAG: S9 family peptidase [Trueperaceae bacterium]
MAKKRIRAEHLYELRFVSEPQLAPGGDTACAVITEIVTPPDVETPRYRSNIHLFSTSGGAGRILTRGPFQDSHPRFSPDGSVLAFLSRRTEKGKAQLFSLPLTGGEAEQLTDAPGGVTEFVWEPSSRGIAFVADYEEEVPDDQPRIVDTLSYRGDGLGWLAKEPAKLMYWDRNTKRCRTLIETAYSPSDLVYSPDGRRIYFLAAETRDDDDMGRCNAWVMPLKSRRLRPLLKQSDTLEGLAVSPSGSQIVFLAPSQPRGVSPTGLWLLPRHGGRPVLLTGELEVVATPSVNGDSRYGSYPNLPAWYSDGRSVVANIARDGASVLHRVGTDGQVSPLQSGKRVVTSFSVGRAGVAFTAETPQVPGELYFWPEGAEEQVLSSVNQDFIKRFQLRTPSKPSTAKSSDGQKVGYWTLRPEKARKDAAMVLQIHGGPHTSYGYGFFFEFQLLVSAGYTVVYGNPRGSSDYGVAFHSAISGRYGSIDADDILAIARHARRKHNENAPVHLTGGSYGGFMTNWLLGQTDEFRSGITQRSICNWVSFYGTSDIGPRFSEREVVGTPWKNTRKLWRQSPLKYVADISTPLLILHAEEDYRCPMEQAEQLFTALKRIGQAPTRLIRFPDENHDLSRSGRPDRRVARLEAILGWFREHA